MQEASLFAAEGYYYKKPQLAKIRRVTDSEMLTSN